MSLRFAKQLIYGAFYLLVFGGIFSFFYFAAVKPEASCFDGIQNQNEEGIDCGGPPAGGCATACLPVGLRPLETIGRVLTFRQGEDRATVLAQVTNPNLDQAAEGFDYSFVFYNEENLPVFEAENSSFAYAGELKYLLLPNVSVPEKFLYVELKIGNARWIPAREMGSAPSFSVSGLEARTEGNVLSAEGQVLNTDTTPFPRVNILAIFRGQYGQIAGVSETTIENLLPNESRQFSIIHPAIAGADLQATKIFAYAQRP